LSNPGLGLADSRERRLGKKSLSTDRLFQKIVIVHRINSLIFSLVSIARPMTIPNIMEITATTSVMGNAQGESQNDGITRITIKPANKL
jgi:hypothetical protein